MWLDYVANRRAVSNVVPVDECGLVNIDLDYFVLAGGGVVRLAFFLRDTYKVDKGIESIYRIGMVISTESYIRLDASSMGLAGLSMDVTAEHVKIMDSSGKVIFEVDHRAILAYAKHSQVTLGEPWVTWTFGHLPLV